MTIDNAVLSFAGFTGFCPVAKALKRLGLRSGCAFR